MTYLIPYLKFLFLYSGWISIVLYFLNVKHFFILSSVGTLLIQIYLSYAFIGETAYFELPVWKMVLLAIVIGLVNFYIEYYIETRLAKHEERKRIEKKEKLNLSFVMIFLIMPISEEIYFRVFVYEWIKSFNLYKVNIDYLFIVISSLVVVINHIQSFMSKRFFIQKLFVEGIWCSIIFLMFKSIWMMIIMHEVLNCMNFLYYYDWERNCNDGN